VQKWRGVVRERSGPNRSEAGEPLRQRRTGKVARGPFAPSGAYRQDAERRDEHQRSQSDQKRTENSPTADVGLLIHRTRSRRRGMEE
jgi:hypothetical protein